MQGVFAAQGTISIRDAKRRTKRERKHCQAARTMPMFEPEVFEPKVFESKAILAMPVSN
jgi:hypothetical protein